MNQKLTFTATTGQQKAIPPAIHRSHFGPPHGNARGETLEVNSFFIERNGEPWLPMMGEFQYSRYPRAEWDTELRKLWSGGVTTLGTYAFWIHHEEDMGVFDWSGQRNLREFLLLARDIGFLVMLRIGPFCHGECRNGGLPDWLYGQLFESRSNDPQYLHYVRRYYSQIATQCHGLMFRDGGPIVGIQLENEYQASAAPWDTTHYPDTELTPLGKDGIEHMRTLKTIAREVGLDVPLWTCTGWGSPIPLGEFIPMFGGYAFYAWLDDPSTQEPSPNYVFRDGHKKEDGAAYDASMTPFAQCEMGSGMQAFYKNRPVVPPESAEAMGCVKLGSAANLIGYYVYHGGCNPVGRHGFLNEHRCPRISYDFFAPIGDFGLLKPSYHVLRRQNLFINAFGSRIAPMPTVLPDGQELVQPGDPLPVRAAIRTDGQAGFLFVNNYQDHLDMPEQQDVSFRIETSKGVIDVPTEGALRLKRGACAILPFNLDMDGIRLVSATAQLITRIETEDGPCYAFFAPEGIAPEFVFDAATIKDPAPAKGKTNLILKPEPGLGSFITLTARDGRTVRFVTLTDAQSKQFWVGKAWGAERFFITEAGLYFKDDGITLYQLDSNRFRFAVYPPSAVEALRQGSGQADRPQAGAWGLYESTVPAWQGGVTTEAAGPRRLAIHVAHQALDGIRDVFVRVDYEGDTGGAYLNGKLIHDNFNNGTGWSIGLRRFAPEVLGNTVVLATTPTRESLTKMALTYTEMAAIQRDDTGAKGAICSVTVHPEYVLTYG